MAIILDADVIIQGEKGGFDLAAWIASRPTDTYCIAAITVAELWHGVERASGRQRRKREHYLRTALSVFAVLPYTAQTALVHARLWAALQDAGTMIGYYDVIVAAAAIEHSCEVATFNQRHFRRVPGLKLILPS